MLILAHDPKAGRTLKNPPELEDLALKEGVQVGIDVVFEADRIRGELMLTATASVTLRLRTQDATGAAGRRRSRRTTDHIACEEAIDTLALLEGMAVDLASFEARRDGHDLQAYTDALAQLLRQEAEVVIEADGELDYRGNPEGVQATILCRDQMLSGRVAWSRMQNYFVSKPEFPDEEE